MTSNPFSLINKTIVITGAGSGIGRATAQMCDSLGARLILLDLNEDGLYNTFATLKKDNHSFIVIDLTKQLDYDKLIKKVAEQQINGLVHCAGISSRKPLNCLKREGFAKVMDINFYSFVELVKIITKRGRMVDGGKIVVMSSISSIKGFKAKTEYCVSKAAVDAFVRCMALELAPRKICINSVMASEVLTPMAIEAKKLNLNNSTYDTPLGPSKPEEVAAAISFLLCDATSTITGTSILIDGGACI